MAIQSPFSLLEDLFQKFPFPKLDVPTWALTETQRRIVLLLNHVLMQESEATARLMRQRGQVMQVQWRAFSLKLEATPAGLLDLAALDAKPDLVLTVQNESPVSLVQHAIRGEKPAVRIEGDVQLAAEVNWLLEHVQWDMEEDLARIIGDVPAHTMSQMTLAVMSGLRQFVAKAAAFVAGPSSS